MTDSTPAEPMVTVVYVGKETRKFGVLIQGTRYRVNPANSKKLELPKSRADSLLSTAGDVWKAFASPDMPEPTPSTVLPTPKRPKDEPKAEG